MKAALHAWLRETWRRHGLAARLLWPLSWLYGLVQGRVMARKSAQARHPDALVIVIGNVVAGGAGKTPLTIAVVQHLLQRGWQVGVISRGHGRRSGDTLAVLAHSHPDAVGDEPLLIHKRTGVPVWVARQRLDAANALLRSHPQVQVLVCDGGLQHRALARDLEICVMDERGIGNGWLLPAGPLREPWPRPTDLLVHHPDQPFDGGHAVHRHLADHAVDGHGQQQALSDMQGRPVDALAAIAKPERFFDMLSHAGITLRHRHALPDHDRLNGCRPAADGTPLLCTEKDAVKLWPQAPEALAVPLELSLPPAFWQALDQRLEGLRARRSIRPVQAPAPTLP